MPKTRKSPANAPARLNTTPALPEIVNLEMDGDRLKVFSLQTLLTNKRSKETRDTARLGDVLLPWFDKMVTKPAEKIEDVLDLWLSLISPALKDRTRLVGFSKGTLTVAAGSSTVRAELDATLRGGLLRELQTQSRGAIYRIKTCVEARNGFAEF
jgi:hypothetical protein